jgi:hypothetical protein
MFVEYWVIWILQKAGIIRILQATAMAKRTCTYFSKNASE